MKNGIQNESQIVIITGMSGAGKTVAIQSFEDLGFFCVDNLPPTLLPKFLELMKESGNKMNKVALVMDLRGREFFDYLFKALDDLVESSWTTPQILFLDADDETLVRRYKETRRKHPLAVQTGLPLEGIQNERALLAELQGRAQLIYNTSSLKPRELREKIITDFSVNKKATFTVNVMSFGFKHGIPIDADLVFDVRFLPNPHYIDHMRPKTGLDKEVSSYVLKWTETHKFLEKVTDLLNFMMPHYKREGKAQLVIAIGCTGGQHRSVALGEYIARYFGEDYHTRISHRDIDKRKGNKTMTQIEQPRVVIIGGGTGLPVLLRGLKKYPIDITAIVTVADDGGSSGRLRNELNIPPPGDVRNVLAALSDVEPLIEEMFQHRFKASNELSGHSLGNLILAAMTSITGDFMYAIQEMSRVLNVHGKVLPAANQSVVLHAELEDGVIISGESKIPYSGKKIKKVFLTPDTIKPPPETLKAIRDADLIIIGPGSLYTSILPNLLVPQIGNEVCEAKGKKVYICNIMTQAGETLDYSASDHVNAIYKHIGKPFMDTILVNSEEIPLEIQRRYSKEAAKPVHFDVSSLYNLGLEVIYGEIISLEGGIIRHDTTEVAKILYSLLQNETKRRFKA